MTIKDSLLGFIDNAGLADVFNRKQTDLNSLRKPLLKGIANTQAQFENGQTKAPHRWWKVGNGVVALTVKVKGDTLAINGVTTNHMPQERFPEFLVHFRQAVEAGEFDDELRNKGQGTAEVHISKTRKNGISPEAAKARGAKAAASRKANRDARAATAGA